MIFGIKQGKFDVATVKRLKREFLARRQLAEDGKPRVIQQNQNPTVEECKEVIAELVQVIEWIAKGEARLYICGPMWAPCIHRDDEGV